MGWNRLISKFGHLPMLMKTPCCLPRLMAISFISDMGRRMSHPVLALHPRCGCLNPHKLMIGSTFLVFSLHLPKMFNPKNYQYIVRYSGIYIFIYLFIYRYVPRNVCIYIYVYICAVYNIHGFRTRFLRSSAPWRFICWFCFALRRTSPAASPFAAPHGCCCCCPWRLTPGDRTGNFHFFLLLIIIVIVDVKVSMV